LLRLTANIGDEITAGEQLGDIRDVFGEVVERGKHQDLIKNNGLYRHIYDLELKDQEEALGSTNTAAAVGGEG